MKNLRTFIYTLILFFLTGYVISLPVHAQENDTNTAIQVTGQVTSEDDEGPLPGVNIVVKGTNIGTTTDADGEYEINVPSEDEVLVFSFVGYETEEVPVNSRTTINVGLQPGTLAGEEIVVVGYGSMEARDLTGSISSVGGEEINEATTANFSQSLQGRVPGVQVIQTSGAPGGKTSIRIRGTTSINASSEPLYVIDGMIVNNNVEEMSIGGRGPAGDPLSSLNPGDIESIEILKDASATAIYGSRGANGVVLITTEEGQAGQNSVSYEGSLGFQEVANKLDLLNATEFAQLVNEAEANAGRNPVYVNPGNLSEGTDWQEELLRVAPPQAIISFHSAVEMKTPDMLFLEAISRKKA